MSLESLVPRLEIEVESPDDASSRPLLSVRGLTKHFTRSDGAKVRAVDSISLDVKPGEFLVLLGPSGCGKTTLLRCIGGLETASHGQLEIEDQVVFDSERRVDIPTRRRGVSMVFQSYALWPNMSVFDNVAFPLKSKRAGKNSKAEVKEKVEEICRLVGVHEVLNQYPSHISGGQQQRVALARALVAGSGLVLFDEPLSNVDAKVRRELRVELAALQDKLGFAAVYVTHDQDDAMELADRIVVLENGGIAQIASPQETYERPASGYVASFVGQTNRLAGIVTGVDAFGVTIQTSLGTVYSLWGTRFAVGDAVDVMFRPQHAFLSETGSAGPNRWQVRYRRTLLAGTHAEVIVTNEHDLYQIRTDADFEPPVRDQVWMSADPKRIMVFPATS